MKQIAATLFFLSGSACAVEQSVFAIAGGATHLQDSTSRELTSDWGYYASFGVSAPEAGFMGYPWLDIDYSRDSGDDNRIDVLGVLYVERVPIGTWWYLGLGAGSFYLDTKITEDGETSRNDRWNIGGKALVGRNFGRLFFEGAYRYSGEISGVSTNAWILSAGFRF